MTLGYRQQEADARIYTVLERTLSSMPVVQAFGREEDANRQLRESTDTTLQAALAATWVQMKFKVSIGLATAFGTAAILYVGAQQAPARPSAAVLRAQASDLFRPVLRRPPPRRILRDRAREDRSARESESAAPSNFPREHGRLPAGTRRHATPRRRRQGHDHDDVASMPARENAPRRSQ